MEVVRIRTSRRGEIGVLFPSVSSLLCRRCREDGSGSRLLGCSCAAVARSVSDERRGKVVVVGAAVRSGSSLSIVKKSITLNTAETINTTKFPN